MNDDVSKLSELSVQFLTQLEQWKSRYYLKEFDINGKEKTKLTDRQYQIMHYIKTGHCNTLKELEKTLELSGSSLSITVSKMVSQGLIQKRTPNKSEDMRKCFLSVTTKGSKMLAQTNERLALRLHDVFIKINKPQRQELHQSFEHIMNDLFKTSEQQS